MNGVKPSGGSPALPVDVYYPDGDGAPMAETGIHVLVMTALIATLRYFFRHRQDVYVIGNIFLYFEEGNPQARRSPDVMVVKGVDATKERRSFKIWEERARPAAVIEITSQETADEDLEAKRRLYERLEVREYFLFDPLHEYLEQPLMGFRLIGDAYEPLPPADDGGLLSAELGMRLVPEGPLLALFSFRTGERVPAPPEAYQLWEQASQRARQAEEELYRERQRAGEEARRAEQERQRAEQERQRAEQERQRAEQLAAEVARLRALLPPEAGEQGPSH
jgi:Uma2 family endonuclease